MAKTDEIFGSAYEKILMQLGSAVAESAKHHQQMLEWEKKQEELTKKALAFLDADSIATARKLEEALLKTDESITSKPE